MKHLRDKTAVITGAASGIGRALALLLAKEGMRLALADVDEVGLAETRRLTGTAEERTTIHRLDVSDRDAVHSFADRVLREHGAAHVIVNNAGVSVAQTISELTYEDFDWIMGINFWGVVHGTQAFLPGLLEQGEGHIVNVSSVFGLIAVPTQGSYNATKFAVRGYTEALREELRGGPVGVSCVHPGGIKTNIVRNARFHQSPGGGRDAAKSVSDFDKVAMTSPRGAAKAILRGIKRNKKRVLIGADARLIDWMQRLLPVTAGRIFARFSP